MMYIPFWTSLFRIFGICPVRILFRIDPQYPHLRKPRVFGSLRSPNDPIRGAEWTENPWLAKMHYMYPLFVRKDDNMGTVLRVRPEAPCHNAYIFRINIPSCFQMVSVEQRPKLFSSSPTMVTSPYE